MLERMKKLKILMVFLCMAALLMFMPACSTRYQEPLTTADSTIVYPPKKTGDISAKITFCRKISKKTGKLIDAGSVFTIGNDEMVHAVVDLENRFESGDRDLMLHLQWIDQDGGDIYRKRIDLTSADSTSTLKSSISISPDKRQPGEYLLQVYLFRELIAEKKFRLLPEEIN
jgi:hypothetical protein